LQWTPDPNTTVRGGEVTWLENQTIATIRVTGSSDERNGTLSDLGLVNFTVPDYLEDLRAHEVDGSHDLHMMTDDPIGGVYSDDDDSHVRTTGNNGCSINGDVWLGDAKKDNLFNVYAFTAEEYDVKASFHPLHVHGTTTIDRCPLFSV
jgi:hypothetical protein